MAKANGAKAPCSKCQHYFQRLHDGVCEWCLLRKMGREERKRWFMCGRKKAFKTPKLAQRYIDKIIKRQGLRPDSKEMRIYPCPYCKRLHVTGSRKTEQKHREAYE